MSQALNQQRQTVQNSFCSIQAGLDAALQGPGAWLSTMASQKLRALFRIGDLQREMKQVVFGDGITRCLVHRASQSDRLLQKLKRSLATAIRLVRASRKHYPLNNAHLPRELGSVQARASSSNVKTFRRCLESSHSLVCRYPRTCNPAAVVLLCFFRHT